jgi:hypothetical protein
VAVTFVGPSGAQPPTITCPADMTVECNAYERATNVTYAAVAPGGSCGGAAPAITYNPPSGSDFPHGTNTVTATASNELGVATCSFKVIVQDHVAPMLIGCPTAPIEAGTDLGNCNAAVNYTRPVASDICDSNVVVSCTPDSGSTFNIGTNAVTCTASDDSGNSASCQFQVIVIDSEPLQIVSPPSRIGVNSVVANCAGIGSFADVPDVKDNCPGTTFSSSLLSPLGIGCYTIIHTGADAIGNVVTATNQVNIVPGIGDIVFHAPTATNPSNDDTDPDGDLLNGYSFKAGQTIPFQIRIIGCDGTDVTADPTLVAYLQAEFDGDGNGTYETALAEEPSGVGGSGGVMALVGSFRKFNLKTTGYEAGTSSNTKSYKFTIIVKRVSACDGAEVVVRSESIRGETK